MYSKAFEDISIEIEQLLYSFLPQGVVVSGCGDENRAFIAI